MQSALAIFPASLVPVDPVTAAVGDRQEASGDGFLGSFQAEFGAEEERTKTADPSGMPAGMTLGLPALAVWVGAGSGEAETARAEVGPERPRMIVASEVAMASGRFSLAEGPEYSLPEPAQSNLLKHAGTALPRKDPAVTGTDATLAPPIPPVTATPTLFDLRDVMAAGLEVDDRPDLGAADTPNVAAAKPVGVASITVEEVAPVPEGFVDAAPPANRDALAVGQMPNAGPVWRASVANTPPPDSVVSARGAGGEPLWPAPSPAEAMDRLAPQPAQPQVAVSAIVPTGPGGGAGTETDTEALWQRDAAVKDGLPANVIVPASERTPTVAVAPWTELPQAPVRLPLSDRGLPPFLTSAEATTPGAIGAAGALPDAGETEVDPFPLPAPGFWERYYAGLTSPPADEIAKPETAILSDVPPAMVRDEGPAIAKAQPDGLFAVSPADQDGIDRGGVVITGGSTQPGTDDSGLAAPPLQIRVANHPRATPRPVTDTLVAAPAIDPLRLTDSTMDWIEDASRGFPVTGPIPPAVAGQSIASATGQPLPAPQIAAQISAALGQSRDGATELALSPGELGRVRLRLKPDPANPDRLTVMITFERPETLDLFRRHAGELADALRQAGFAGADIGFGQQGQSGFGWDRQEASSGPSVQSDTWTEAVSTVQPALRLLAGASLDLRV